MASAETCYAGYQPFPKSGPLARNVDLDLSDLIRRIDEVEGTVYCYVVRTVECDRGRFAQLGSAPNFQGGLVTLCTCKWRMRAAKDADMWMDGNTWIAGVTGAAAEDCGRGHLFYLMHVQRAFSSHHDLWSWLAKRTPEAAEAKAADRHQLGDVYVPLDSPGDYHDPGAYALPRRDHVHWWEQRWHKDISYRAYGRWSALLVGDPEHSFLWSEPKVPIAFPVGRGYMKVGLQRLLNLDGMNAR